MLTESSCWRRGGFLVGGDVFVNDELHDATIVGVQVVGVEDTYWSIVGF